MSILNNSLLLGAAAAASSYQIQRSLRFNSADSAYLNRTPGSAGNRKTWTWAGWVKRSALNASSNDGHLFVCNNGASDSTYARLWITNNRFYFGVYSQAYRGSADYFRDLSAWYHFVCAVDTTQATASNRVRMYVNGSEITSFAESVNPALNADLAINQAAAHLIGAETASAGFFNGYLADIHFIDGQALTPSSFGETDANGVWQPKAYSGTYGTNGFRLDFSDNSAATATTLGKDAAGSNNWTLNNLSVTAGSGNDSLVDSPTNYGTDTGAGGEVRGNYATLNPLDHYSTITLTNGNLEVKVNEAQWRSVRANFGMSTGKWYWEVLLDAKPDYHMHGIGTTAAALTTYPGNTTSSWGWNYGGGLLLGGNSSGTTNAYTANCVLGFAFNADTGVVNLYLNGTLQSGAFTLPAGTYFPILGVYGVNIGTANFNAGQRPFAYVAPSGFKALCTQNLPAPTITKPSTVMDTVLWTGNGSARSITGLGFNPDLVWIKGRSGATDHALYDSVRGVEKRLESNNTDAEVTSDGGVTAFNSDGFSLGTLAQVNTNSATYAGWCWDESVSAGFDIVTYTGNGANRTIAHSLGVAPQFLIVKQRTAASSTNWAVWHNALANTEYLLLNTTAAKATGATYWNSTSPTSSVLSLGTAADVNANNGTYVAYCFAPVAGYSAFGSYTGMAPADGPFVYTGFRPRWILIKALTTASGWQIYDAARDTVNQANNDLSPSDSLAENGNGVSDGVDILSNGFKLRSTDSWLNGSTYIYAAFAEAPFQLARAR